MDVKYPHFVEALRRIDTNQKRLAAKLGVNRRMVAHYLAGTYLPRAETLVAFPDLYEGLRRDMSGDKRAA